MNKLSPEQLIKINKALCDKAGLPFSEGDSLALLGEIADAPYEKDVQLFYIYSDTISKAAKLACEIEVKKPFARLNRATAVISIITLLQVNDMKLTEDLCSDRAAFELVARADREALENYLRRITDSKYLQVMLTDT